MYCSTRIQESGRPVNSFVSVPGGCGTEHLRVPLRFPEMFCRKEETGEAVAEAAGAVHSPHYMDTDCVPDVSIVMLPTPASTLISILCSLSS